MIRIFGDFAAKKLISYLSQFYENPLKNHWVKVHELGKTEDQIVEVLQTAGKPLTLVEIAEQMGKPPKKMFSSLRKLFEAGKVNCDNKTRTYTLTKE